MTTMTLNADELALIETKRQREEEERVRREKEQAKREERLRKEQERHLAQSKSLVDALVDADTAGIVTVGPDNNLYFDVGDTTYNITIEEHRVSSGRSWSSSSKGYKYLVHGAFNDYKRQYYKRPASLLKKIQEWQNIHDHEVASKKAKASLGERALEFAKTTYPNATVEFEKGYDYRSGRYHQNTNSYRPDTVNVSTDRGSYEFSFGEIAGKVVLGTWKRSFASHMNDEICKLILE